MSPSETVTDASPQSTWPPPPRWPTASAPRRLVLLPPREVHVSILSRQIASFMEADRARLICFRCGQTGHVRSQCMHFKVRLCWHYGQGRCVAPTSDQCSFAHGEAELRYPWRSRCVRVVKQPSGAFVCIGCNSDQHTFRKCPHNKGILML